MKATCNYYVSPDLKTVIRLHIPTKKLHIVYGDKDIKTIDGCIFLADHGGDPVVYAAIQRAKRI